jgi:carbamoyl-phosphate synthase large subunit
MKNNDNEKPRDYKDLIVWQKAMRLAKEVYRATSTYPKEERFGLVAQMRRAAVSIPSNIAEGQARHTSGEFVQFISYAEGSLAELDTQALLSIELGFVTPAAVETSLSLIGELRRMLNALRRKLT